ncbi:MAG: hypothetical protein MZW92_19430 [Comamonadaceae bacterium]|nr:hypothetical protein [Comamonadaceae bacterium]
MRCHCSRRLLPGAGVHAAPSATLRWSAAQIVSAAGHAPRSAGQPAEQRRRQRVPGQLAVPVARVAVRRAPAARR